MNHYATTASPAGVADPKDLLAEVAMWAEHWRDCFARTRAGQLWRVGGGQ